MLKKIPCAYLLKTVLVLLPVLFFVLPVKAQTKYVVGFSQSTVYESWRIMFNQSLRQATDEFSEIELLVADGQDQGSLQARDILNFVEQSVDAIIVAPKSDPLVVAAVNHAYLKEIPVIVIDNLLPNMEHTQYIGVDNYMIGQMAAQRVIESINIAVALKSAQADRSWHVVEICGHPRSEVTKHRHTGFINTLADQQTRSIKYYAGDACDFYANWKQDEAQLAMMTILNTYPNVDFIFAHNDQMAFGASLAIEQLAPKRKANIQLLGVDALQTEGQKWVQEGVLNATYSNPVGGRLVLEQILHILEGEAFEKTIRIPSTEVTQR